MFYTISFHNFEHADLKSIYEMFLLQAIAEPWELSVSQRRTVLVNMIIIQHNVSQLHLSMPYRIQGGIYVVS